MATTMTMPSKRTRKAKPAKRFPYPTMPRTWYTDYFTPNANDRPIDYPEQMGRNAVERWGNGLGAEHKEALYIYAREAIRGDWTALVALADLLSDAEDFDPTDAAHPANVALETACRALAKHLEENKAYLASRGRARGGNPLREFRAAVQGVFGETNRRDANLALIADRMRHGECE